MLRAQGEAEVEARALDRAADRFREALDPLAAVPGQDDARAQWRTDLVALLEQRGGAAEAERLTRATAGDR